MIVVDIGNTETVIGLYYNGKLKKIDRIISSNSGDVFEKFFFKYFRLYKKLSINLDSKLCVISSVVPKLTKTVINNIKNESYKYFLVKGNSVHNKLKIKYNLNQIGSDRIANSIAVLSIRLSEYIGPINEPNALTPNSSKHSGHDVWQRFVDFLICSDSLRVSTNFSNALFANLLNSSWSSDFFLVCNESISEFIFKIFSKSAFLIAALAIIT